MKEKLPDAWIKKIFQVMHANYGSKWLRMWMAGQVVDGEDVGIVNAMQIWAEKLANQRPDTIKRALDSLPLEPPTLPQFVELCRSHWIPPIMLEAKITPEEIARNKAKIKAILDGMKNKQAEQ